MSRYLFETDTPTSQPCGQPCYTPMTDIWEKVERTLCSPKRQCCPPKTKARDAIIIRSDEAERCFFYGRRLCDGTKTQSVVNQYYNMVVRQRGYCEELMCVPPHRATMDGSICWAWPPEFRRLPTGYYEADIYIDNCLCHTHLFVIQPCNMSSQQGGVSYDDNCVSCVDSCENDCIDKTANCCAKIPQVDGEISQPKPVNCERGKDRC